MLPGVRIVYLNSFLVILIIQILFYFQNIYYCFPQFCD